MGVTPCGAFAPPAAARSRGLQSGARRATRACVSRPRAVGSASLETKRWMRSVVVELGLCPFAAAALDAGGVRVREFDASDERGAESALRGEIAHLLASDACAVETALVVLPSFAEDDFLRWHSFTNEMERIVENDEELVDQVMLACFHPWHKWAGLPADDAVHFDRRAPHPIVNILRAAQVDAAVDEGRTDGILERNQDTLREIGYAGMRRMYAAL